MNPPRLAFVLLAVCLLVSLSAAQDRLFNGKNLDDWQLKHEPSRWSVAVPKLRDDDPTRFAESAAKGNKAIVNLVAGHGQSSDIYSKKRFGDCRIELDVMVPKGANSGIYVMGEYEVQVLDSFGRDKLGTGDMGAIYGAAPPRVNATKAPGTWQHFVIDFQAPRFDDAGNKLRNARFLRVVLNGAVIQQDAELPGPTPGGLTGKEAATGPLMFQGDHGPVAYRDIEVIPLSAVPLAIPPTDDGLPGSGPLRRFAWFRRLWLRKRTEWAKDVDKDKNALVFLGDSITQSWGPKLGDSFPGVKVANRGISGDTTRGVLVRMDRDVLALDPRGVVLLIGTNDLEEKAAPETIADNVALIIDRLKRHDPKMPIILCKVFPSTAKKSRSAKDIKRTNQLCFQKVKGDSRVTVLDTWTLFAGANGDANKAEFPDLLHPNKAGYAKWAAALRPLLATYGFVDNEPDDFALEPGFESLFNGRDLTGWCFRRKETLEVIETFDGKPSSTRGRYRAIAGRLVVTTPPEGRRIQQLWTKRELSSDFVLELEFRATPNADSGVFIRGRQLQCRDYSLAGPYRRLERYKPQDWNKLVITVIGQTAHCTCNGEVLEANFAVPASGPIGLEGDRGQLEYRRIRVKAR